jgi:fructose-specific phosphotransferase system IIC component
MLTFLVALVIGFVAGFVVGILFGRKNPKKIGAF